MEHKWDFFIAHAGNDITIAERLYELLIPASEVFLDSKSLILGDDWDRKLSENQQDSLITIVIITPNTDSAYYQREEIAIAIQMARKDESSHRVIPLFISSYDETKIPYGLRIKNSLYLKSEDELDTAAKRLLETLYKIQPERKKNNRGKNPLRNNNKRETCTCGPLNNGS
jgi:hypothetical protein